jgi:hypothetical protein
VPAHAEESLAAGAMFAISALALAVVAVLTDRGHGAAPLAAAALLLGALLAAYAATRVVALWPFGHAEAIDAIGVLTKSVEAAGLLLALRLLLAPASSRRRLPALPEGAGP